LASAAFSFFVFLSFLSSPKAQMLATGQPIAVPCKKMAAMAEVGWSLIKKSGFFWIERQK